MNDDFLIQVDEEVPSDQRVAVNILETRILSEEYRDKLETLLDKIDKMTLTSNIDILSEMKNILNDMLVSIISINKNYAFVSEMVLKTNDRIEQNDPELLKSLEGELRSVSENVSRLDEKINVISIEMNEKMPFTAESIDILKEGILDISERLDNKINTVYGEIGEVFNRLEEKIDEMSVMSVAIDRKIDDKLNDIKVESKRLEEKIGEMSVRNAEVMSKFDEKIYDTHEAAKAMLEKIEEIGSISAAASDVLTDLNEKISNIDERGKSSDVEALREEMNEKTDRILSKVEKIENYIDMFTLKVQYVRRGKKSKPRKARRPAKRRRQIEDEALDILIINTLKNVSMNMGSLKRSTEVGEKRLRTRLEVLMTRGVVAREKRGRSIFYVSRVDEATELDN